jgi:peroxiredoxin
MTAAFHRRAGLRRPEILTAAFRQRTEAEPPAADPARPRTAPAFDLEDIKGRRHSLALYTGRTVHLFFFAVWCPPCLEQLRRIEVADAHLRGRGYRVVLVAMKDREDGGTLRSFVEERTLTLPVAWDNDGAVARDYGVASIPTHVLISPQGRIVYQGSELPDGFERDGAGLLPP